MATNGMLIAVRWEWDGTELTADVATGVAVLPVLDPFALSADELCWVGDTGPYTVASTDEDASTITLTSGVTEDMETSTQVPPDVGGIPSQVWVAEVVLPDAEEPIEVPLTIHDLAVMPEGEYDPPVAIEISDDYRSVIDLPGSIPIINGGLIPPDTLPPVDGGGSDGQVPPSSPQPDVTGGIGAFYLRWAPPPNNDPLRFEVHVSDSSGFAPTATTKYTETSAYSATVRSLPWIDTQTGELAKFQYGVNYYFRIIAKDEDGSAAPSLEDFGQMMQVTGPDIAARTVAGENIIGGTITGDLFAGNVILGSKISTGTLDANGNIVGARIDLSPDGFIVYDANGTPITAFPLDQKGLAYIRQSRLEILSADVIDNFTMHGVNNAIAASSKLTLSNAVSAPTSSPSVATLNDTVQLDTKTQFAGTGAWAMGTFPLDPSQIKNIAWHTDGYWQIIQEKNSGTRLWRFNPDGTFKINVFSGSPWHDDFKGFTCASVASNGSLMFSNNGGSSYMLYGGAQIPAAWIINTNQVPYLSYDPAAGSSGQFMLCQSPGGSSPKSFQIRRFTIDANNNCVNASLQTIPANFAVGRTNRINGCLYLTADFGAARYVQTAEGSPSVLVFTTAQRFNTNGAYQEWTEPVASNGLGYDGGSFWSVDSNGIMTKYTNWTWPEYPTTTFVGMSGYDSNPAGDQANPWPGQAAGTHETPVGLMAQITQPRRSKETITVPVTNQTTGPDDQDKWKVYWARTSGAAPTAAQMKFVATLGSTSVPQSVTLLADPAGAAPPGGIGGQTGSGNNFPAGNPARIVSAALDTGGLPLIDLRGDGAGRMGPFKWDSAGRDLSKNGLYVGYFSTAANNMPTGTFVIVTGIAVEVGCSAPELNAGAPGGQISIAVPGVYHIIARGTIASGGGVNPSRRIAALYKNNVEYVRTDIGAGAPSAANPATVPVEVVLRLVPTDTISLQLWQNSGSTITMGSNPGHMLQFIKLSD